MALPTTPQIGPALRAWYRWKALRLPWRKRLLVGLDLQGNTYWIFREARLSKAIPEDDREGGRWRRIVKYPSSTHYGDVKVPPQWHQWLRYLREHPPSLSEQVQDAARRDRVKVLAAEADARWKAKSSLLDMPAESGKGRASPTTTRAEATPQVKSEPTAASAQPSQEQTTKSQEDIEGGKKTVEKEVENDPWKRASGPSESWQPQAWSPTSARKR